MIVSQRLHEIVKKSFDSREWAVGRYWEMESEWHHHMYGMGALAEPISYETTVGVSDTIAKVFSSLNKSDDVFVCPDPMNPGLNGLCSLLLFPKELAERIMILGYLPVPETAPS